MFNRIQSFIKSPKFKELIDVRNIGLYVFTFIVIAVFWSGVKTVQTNYQLQRKVATLEQENEVKRLENDNLRLRNKFLETEQYLELAARRQFAKASPGEAVYNVPEEVALQYAPPEQSKPESTNGNEEVGNFQAWKDFLLGRATSQN